MKASHHTRAIDRVGAPPVAITAAAYEALRAQPMYRAQVRRWPETLLELFAQWRERARQRRQLLELDDHLLRDIGLTRAEVQVEYDKPFWLG